MTIQNDLSVYSLLLARWRSFRKTNLDVCVLSSDRLVSTRTCVKQSGEITKFPLQMDMMNQESMCDKEYTHLMLVTGMGSVTVTLPPTIISSHQFLFITLFNSSLSFSRFSLSFKPFGRISHGRCYSSKISSAVLHYLLTFTCIKTILRRN